MRQHVTATYALTRFLLLAFAVAFIVFDASAVDCERRIAADGPSARTIVLAGGDAWLLFRQFLAELEQRDLDISLRRSEVQISRGGQVETFELGWSRLFSTDSAEAQWQRQLSGKRAEVNSQLLAEARVGRWDVVCVGQIAKPQPIPVPKAQRDRSEALLFFKSGLQYASKRDYRNALKEFKAAERISPTFDGLLMNIGVTYLQLNDYVQAAAYLHRAIQQNPKGGTAHYNMACLQARMGQKDDAIASLTAAKSNGMEMTPSIRRDPDLSSLRGRKDFGMLFN